jgi:IS605 OrfB family transposase
LERKQAKPKDYISIPITFSYYGRFIAYAVDQKKPITYRFICIDGVWKVQIIVDHPNIPYVTDEKNGSIGIDQNPLNISYASIKPDGNCEISEVFKIVQGHRSANQAENELANIVNGLIDLAVLKKRPIVIERLNFQQIQKELKARGLNRLLSRFKYSLFHKLLYSRAAKHGVQIIEVNPAYSSIIGWLKFGYGYGLSKHQAAAIAIGRRIIRPNGKRFSERICVRLTPGHPAAHLLSKDASAKPACKFKRKRTEHVWTEWNRLRKLLVSKSSASTCAGKSKQPAASRQLAL